MFNIISIKKSLLFLVVICLLVAGFYFKEDLANLYLALTQKKFSIQNFVTQDLVEEIKTQVIAPPPLRTFKKITSQTVLTTQGVINRTNLERANSGLPPLKENALLNEAALAKVKDMFKYQYFEHESPAGAGPGDLADNVGYQYILIGENLALGNYEDDKALVQAWMDSPGHRANILNNNFQEIGVSVLKGTLEKRTTWLAVQEFGLPLSVCEQPNAALKNQIDFNERQLKDLAGRIEAARADFETLARRDPSYSQKVQLYNDLVNQYNALILQTKNLASQYNTQVSAFNQCTASF